MKLKQLLLVFIFCLGANVMLSQKSKFEISSPNGLLKAKIDVSDKIYYSIFAGDEELSSKNHLALQLKSETLGANPKVLSSKTTTVNETIKPTVPLKFSTVPNVYNVLILNCKGGYSVEFRAFDEGIAYRFITAKKGDIEILNEDFSVHFSEKDRFHLQFAASFKSNQEELYSQSSVKDWSATPKMATLPILIETAKQYKVLISESDLSDYPCLFLKGTTSGMNAIFPKVPLQFGPDGDRSLKITQEANYIAKTAGTRTFPWRYFIIAKHDKQLIENTMTLKLAPKSEIKETSWIQPGQVSWEWWNGAAPYGPDVNFVSGYNLDTYKYFIDFASKQGIKYIIMDEGWAKSTEDPYTPNPNIDLKELIQYGKERKVDIILWLTWLAVDRNMELFKTFKEWGIAGVKIDFMDRNDQVMVNFYEKVVKEAAKHQIVVDFHGAFKPAGLEYKYPNLLSYEGVRGMEQMEGCKPDNSLYLPFMRNAVGPMDYTPGAMISMQPEVYRSERPNAAGIGTRAHQLALFVVFESGLQMLADNPTNYYREKECTDFITAVSTTWDETKALEAKTGQYAIVAKRKGKKWFIGGITNNAESERTFQLDLGFLKTNTTYRVTTFEDGINAGHQAMDYRKKSFSKKSQETIEVKMKRNGGFAAVFEEE